MVHIIEKHREALDAAGYGVDILFEFALSDFAELRTIADNENPVVGRPLYIVVNPEEDRSDWAYTGPLQDREAIALAATIRARITLEKYAKSRENALFEKIFEHNSPEELATMRAAMHEFIQEMGDVARIRRGIEDEMHDRGGIIEDERTLTDEEKAYYQPLIEDGMQMGPYTAARCTSQVIRRHQKDADAATRLGALIGQVFYTEFFDKAKDVLSS